MIVAVTILTDIIVLDRWEMLFSHTLNPCGVNSVRCTRVQSDDDQAEVAFEKIKGDCWCRPVSDCSINPETCPYVM